jgi:acyl-[acyl-carrier-protein] desaturase
MIDAMSEMRGSDLGADLLEELREPTERLLNHHLNVAKMWFPFEFIPWGEGHTYSDEEIEAGRNGTVYDSGLPQAAKSALYVNLLTEDNLPYYYNETSIKSPFDHPWGVWTRQWTAEEDRHSTVIRDYLMIRRSIDPWALEKGRMQQESKGEIPRFNSLADALIYTSIQEPATKVSHRNTGKYLDAVGRKIMAIVAGDENLHGNFYQGVASAAFEVDPSTMVEATNRQVQHFQMPGTGIPGFAEHAKIIAAAGIYDYRHFHEIVEPLIGSEGWDIEHIENLTPSAEVAREELLVYVQKLGRVALRRKEKLAAISS